jgi:hypothetical protein
VKKPDVIQKNELYFCNQGSNVIQNQLSKSKHRLKSFVLQACVMKIIPRASKKSDVMTFLADATAFVLFGADYPV